jgi:betaine-aldehyde dehydrogenase
MREHKMFIGGEWISAANREVFAINDPATCEQVASVASGGPKEVDQAVASAKEALETSNWARDGRLRASVLLEWASALEKQVETLARELTRQNGKVLAEARYEIGSQVDVIRYNAGLARTISGRAQSLGRDVFGVVAREPMGVVAVISPWNWPVTLMVRDMAPAMAAGNAVIVKPASQTAAVCVDVLHSLAECSELLRGILSVVTGPGPAVGGALAKHPGVDMIAFTGDLSTGRSVARDAAETFKKISLELGGKSPMVVCADANLDRAVTELVRAGLTTTSGQICTAPSRLLVEESIHGEVLDRLRKIVAELRIGSGLSPETQVGPLSTLSQHEKVLSYIELGRKQARLVAGGQPLKDAALSKGHYVMPAVFDQVPQDSPLLQEEIFGPVVAVQTFKDDADAARIANSTRFGLAGAVWTENVHRAWDLARAIQSGTVWVNTYNRFYPETEVGGYKESGIGRMAGLDGLLEFTQTKHINFDSSVARPAGSSTNSH